MFTSYAQNFEDVMLWRALRHVDRGFYVDVGAQDPVVDSVSLGFYEQGWRGVHVEPVAAYARSLRERRPDEVVLQVAVGAHPGTLTLYEIADTGLSTARREIALGHGGAGYTPQEVEVECLTLEQVLAPYAARDIHWLKVDVEGFEREVLAGWGSAAQPWIVVVESTLPRTQSESHQEWESLLIERGYAFAWFDGLNRFYVSGAHPELMPAFQYGPTPFDEFVLSATSVRADGWRRESQALAARAADAERKLGHATWQMRGLEQRLEGAEAHIAAMTSTVSWRITAPLRRLRRVMGPAPHADGTATLGLVRRSVNLAKRWGVYSRIAPWVRERYPGHWSRAKRWLLEGAPARIESRVDGLVGAGRAPVGTSIPHSADVVYRAAADSNSVSVDELAALLEQEIARQRTE